VIGAGVFAFVVDYEGRAHNCTRHVTGSRVLRQTVVVAGVDQRLDGHSYGSRPGNIDPAFMESNAKRTAHEILRAAFPPRKVEPTAAEKAAAETARAVDRHERRKGRT
jgi:hypothetical protein